MKLKPRHEERQTCTFTLLWDDREAEKQSILLTLKQCERAVRGLLAPKQAVGQREKKIEDEVKRDAKRAQQRSSKQEGG